MTVTAPPPPRARSAPAGGGPEPISTAQAVAEFEARMGVGYAAVELGRYLWALQQADRLLDPPFPDNQEDVMDEYLRVATTDWLRHKQWRPRGSLMSVRRFVAFVNETAEGRQYQWGSLGEIAKEPQRVADVVAQSEHVLLNQVPGMVERHARILHVLGEDTRPVEVELHRRISNAFETARSDDTLLVPEEEAERPA